MIGYVISHENPAAVNLHTEKNLHNITQAIVTEDTRKSLLNVMQTGHCMRSSGERERDIDKAKDMSDAIPRALTRPKPVLQGREKRRKNLLRPRE